ncbi:PEP-CTERM sorting domain-containing protein [Mitsuaria sp. GD03876]|uniref:PEP-CTERM sorting domain-containing protein n=1 Tax=Mitsuaria sp. GD03876 TaxID=2975399 RepID=UPI002446D725|nr:PEP-CTERM sorting domain-containing protein [Mitsuaria sp. GD03876]MDH0865308.1 PEP-CTERM sorting domain-containing protein [Mitsuaria sp. GD03876]
MTKHLRNKSLVAALCLGAAAAAQALPLTNGDFENGLAGWYSRGWTDLGPGGSNTAIVDAASPYAPISGSSAMIVAVSGNPLGPNWTCAQDVWNLACPLPMPFTAPGAGLPTYTFSVLPAVFHYGAFLARDLTVAAGDTLNWDWRAYGELAVDPFYDNGWFYATNGDIVERVALREGGHAYTFSQGGLWSVYFGVGQSEDSEIWSAVMLDNVSLEAAQNVPEPTSVLLGLAGLAALGVSRRKRA